MQSFHNPCQYSAQHDTWPRSFNHFVAGLSNGSGPAMVIQSSMDPFEAVTFEGEIVSFLHLRGVKRNTAEKVVAVRSNSDVSITGGRLLTERIPPSVF